MVRPVLFFGTLLALILATSSSVWSQASDAALHETLEQILQSQASAWNEGSIEGFMEHYWKSKQLSFCSGGKRQLGWKTVFERYRQRYPTPEKMGQLAFSNLDVRSLGDDAALVMGDWQLTRQEDQPGGNFSLVFQRVDGKWVITHDHTSSREDDSASDSED